MAPGPAEERPPQRRRGRAWLPIFFAALAAVLLVAAIVVTVRERNDSSQRTAPPAAPGQNELIHVVAALRAGGLDAEPARQGAPRGELAVPGQGLTVAGSPAFVYVFPDAAAAADARDVDPMRLLPAGATPAAAAAPVLLQGSNIVLVMTGGDDAQHQAAQRALDGLP